MKLTLWRKPMGSNAKFKKNNDQLYVQLEGNLDEECSFPTSSLSGFKTIIFDFGNVTGINSCGIREWIRWISAHKDTSTMYFRNCPKIIVDQINMVDGFLPSNGRVESFFVPYYSEETDEEKHILFSYGVEFNDSGIHYPEKILDSKNQPMEIDVIESKYFRFLQKFPKSA